MNHSIWENYEFECCCVTLQCFVNKTGSIDKGVSINCDY